MSDLKSLVTFAQAKEWPEASDVPAQALVLIEVDGQVYKIAASRLVPATDPGGGA